MNQFREGIFRIELIFLFSILLLAFNCYAQFPQLHFENLTTSNGLSDNEVTCFYQDHDGFLWVGTKFGLNRFDGKIFQTFYHNPDDSNSISGNNIVDLLQDSSGIFWIATKDGGLTRYDPKQPQSKQFRQFINRPGNPASLPTNRLNCLFDYNKDYLLIGAEVFPAIFLNKKDFSIRTWSFDPLDTLHPHQPFSPETVRRDIKAGSWIHKIQKRNDTLFAAFLTAATVKLVVQDTLQWAPETYLPSMKIQTPSDFCLDGNKIWQANWSPGLFVQTTSAILPSDIHSLHSSGRRSVVRLTRFSDITDVVTHVVLWNDSVLIAGTATSGIYLVNKKNGKEISFVHDDGDPHSVASNSITALFKDRNDIWWIGTKQGISKYNPQQWQFNAERLPVKSGHDINCFSTYEDDKGTLRICTSDGIYKRAAGEKDFHLVQFRFRDKLLQPTLIFRVDSSRYILGTELSFYNYDPTTETIAPVPLSGEKDFPYGNKLYDYYTYQIRSMIKDTFRHQPVLWYAPLGWGLGLYEMNDEMHYDLIHTDALPTSIRNNLSRKVVLDKHHDVWVATSEGLYKWRRNDSLSNSFDFFLHRQGDSTSISNNDITDIFVDDSNHLWITTNGGGLNEYNGSRFFTYHALFPSFNSMYGIYPDHHNRFWIPSAAGFEVFDRKAKTFRHIDLPSASWMLKLPARIFAASDGRFLYGAQNSLISFHPDEYKFNNSVPQIYLSDVELFNQHYEVTPDNHCFAFNKNYFTFIFSSLQLGTSGTVHYRYFLMGFDHAWSEATEEGKANYTNLPPGSYSFEVETTSPLGEWSASQSLLAFTIRSPFWRCWWFYLACSAMVIAIGYTVFQIRLRQLMRIQKIRNRIANDLHDDVGSALSTISLYTQVAQLKSKDEKGLKEVLEKISSTSQEMQENMSHIVWSIQPRNDRFDQVILHMRQNAIEMLQPKNIEVHFNFDEKLLPQKLSAEQRKELFLIFKEAIHNISKYANCSSVHILFRRNGQNIEMVIQDNGVGFDSSQKSDGNGLFTMQERAQQLHGKLNVQSSYNEGTSVTLLFPV